MDCSPPGSSEHGISQAKILEWVAISSSRRSSQPRDRTFLSTSQVLIFYRIKSLSCHIHFKRVGEKTHSFPFLYHGMCFCFYLFFTGAILSMKFNKRKCSLVRFLSLPLLLFVPFHNFMKNIFVV